MTKLGKDVPDVILKAVDIEDEAFILRVFESTRERERDARDWEHEAWDEFIRTQCEAQRRHYTTHFSHPDHRVVCRGKERVGRVWISRSSDEIRLLDIAVLPEYRCRGVGTTVIRRLQSEASAAGVPLRHSVELENPRARRLYERLGFVAVKTHGLHTLMEWDPAAQPSHLDA
jgi:ribosomal protein S18 acetylase RimI-like enzyme